MREKIEDIFRCFSTWDGTNLPSFDHWCPESREIFIRHAYHSSQVLTLISFTLNQLIFMYSSAFYLQAAIDFNEMVCYYKALIISTVSSEELDAAKRI